MERPFNTTILVYRILTDRIWRPHIITKLFNNDIMTIEVKTVERKKENRLVECDVIWGHLRTYGHRRY